MPAPLPFPRLRTGAARALAAVVVTVLTTAGLAAGPAVAHIPDTTQFYAADETYFTGALKQASELRAAGDHASADALETLVSTPQSVWLVSGAPEEVRQQASRTTQLAADQDRLPVLVPYNLPFRDCALYSAGGASSVAEYESWIEAVAAGIGDRPALVVLEPDSLGTIPWHTTVHGDPEWCQPSDADSATAAQDRFLMLRHAVQTLKELPNTRVYLDGTHSRWLGAGDAAHRLVQAGVGQADGFFLNVSNYELTENQLRYGTWVSQCIHYGTVIAPGRFQDCADQYYPADPEDPATWSSTDAWYAEHVERVPGAPSGPADLTHFVVDTSRNGQGPWTPTRDYPDPETWCNPPGRGLGLLPTAATGHALADAFLWIKAPGESDGSCTRGLGPGAVDPEWGRVDPPPGAWFPEQILDLIRNSGFASPFTDVPRTHPFYGEIVWMADSGISGGWRTADGRKEYRPHTAVDRDVMAAFLYRLAGSPAFTAPTTSPFTDITPQSPFYKEMAWLADSGISGGWRTADGRKEYRPHTAVDRDVMAAFLYRLAGSPAFTAPKDSPFTDITPQSAFYQEMAWLADSGISGGWRTADGRKEYRPHTAVDRDVMAAFLHRLDPLL